MLLEPVLPSSNSSQNPSFVPSVTVPNVSSSAIVSNLNMDWVLGSPVPLTVIVTVSEPVAPSLSVAVLLRT